MKTQFSKSLFHFGLILLLSISIISCNIFSSRDSSQVRITLSNQSLSADDTIHYNVVNNNDKSVFIYLNGSVTNIEKKTGDGWIRLINTLSHYPYFISYEIEPGSKFEASLTFELIEKLTEEPSGVYRIAYDYNTEKNNREYDIVTSRAFTVH